MSFEKNSLGSTALRCLSVLVLLAFSQSAWAISVSPSPSYTGSYTVSWSTTLGCTYNNDPPFYSYTCYSLYENWVEVATSGTSLPVTGKPVGSYEYQVFYVFYVYGQPYDWGAVEGPVTVDVLPPPPSFSIGVAPATSEGDTMVFTVTRSGTTTGSYSVSYNTYFGSGATATTADATPTSGTLTFASGETSKTISVSTTEEAIYEANEYFYVQIHSPTGGATISTPTNYGYINNDDAAPAFSINDTSVSESGILTFTVTKSGSTELTHSVSFATATGTAGSSDFQALANTLSFTSGQSSLPLSIQTTQDSLYESTERMYVDLSSATGGATISDTQGYGDITNDDAAPSFTINDVGIGEGGTLSFTVTKSGATELSHNVSYSSADSSAVAGSDYTAVSGTLTFASGQTTQTVAVSTTGDSVYEGNELLVVNLSSATNGATIADANGVGTINDDDAGPSFTINDVTIGEGGTLSFTVTKSGSTALSHNVSYASANGSAASGSDYTAVSGTLTFTSGQTTQAVNVTTAGDSIYEGNETVNLNLSGATNGATIGDSQGVGTINDDDQGPSFTLNDVSIGEGGTLSFTVTKSGSTALSHNVSYASANGSAVSGSDYTAASGTLTFTSGQTTQTVNITTADDSVYESNETVNLNLSSATNGATIADSQGVGTINDNDAGPSFTINDVSIGEGGALSFTVTKSGSTVFSHNVSYASANGSAVSGSDYTAVSGTLTFTSGQTTQTVNVTTADDSIYEGNETVNLNLSSPTSGATIADSQGVGTINDNDAGPSFTINDVSIGEGGTLSFTVTKSGSTVLSHNVSYASANGSAVSGSDYTAVSGTLTFTSGQATQGVTVSTATDVWFEGNETVALNLSGATSGATIGDTQGIGTIDDANDDTVTGAAAISVAPNTTGFSPGATPGGLTVDVTGNLSYQLPIVVPPGTGGMEPDLGLVYSSANGNGLVGVGWTISGLSAITRCAMTTAQDSAIDGIDYDATDRFCLDGQRLMVVNALAYGADGAEYRTELDQFAKVVSHGTSGSGPSYFTVRTKSGRILEYGNTPDSKVEIAAGQSTVRVWAVSKISDTTGNYMTVSYSDQSSQTDFQPELISYTMNSTVTTPFASVDFVYESRPDIQVSGLYQGGWAVTRATNRLANVRTYNGATLVRDYDLSYDNGGIGGASRLLAVTECPAAGSCLPPTSFGWLGNGAAPNLTATPIALPSGITTTDYEPMFADWNGDGRSDLFLQAKTAANPSRLYVADAAGTQQPTGFNPTTWPRVPSTNSQRQVITGDFNADGRTDLLVLFSDYVQTNCYDDGEGGQICFDVFHTYLLLHHATVDGQSMTLVQTIDLGTQEASPFLPDYVKTGDWNGDGRTDVIIMLDSSSGYAQRLLADSSGQLTITNPVGGALGAYLLTGDFDGDGRTDLMHYTGAQFGYLYLSDGVDFGYAAIDFGLPWSSGQPLYKATPADFNGDGLDDLFFSRKASPYDGYLYLSKGNGSFAYVYSGSGFESLFAGDWNADGRPDIAYRSGTTMHFAVATGNPAAFFAPLTSIPNWGASTLLSADFNGDGVGDLWRRTASSDEVYAATNGGPDLLDEITGGLGAVTTVAYSQMTAGGPFYTKGAAATYPGVTVQNTRRLVSSVTANDGTFNGSTYGTRVTNYQYERGVVDLSRRASLGFGKFTSIDTRADVKHVTIYEQAFPFVGMPTRTERRVNSTNLLIEETDYTNTEPTPVAGVHSPFVQVADTKVYELDSVLVSRARATTQYDTFGNPTSVTVDLFDNATQTTGAPYSTVTSSYFKNDTTSWLIGQLICQKAASSAPSLATQTRTYGFEYQATTGLLVKEVVEPATGTVNVPSGVIPSLTECVTASSDGDITLISTHGYDSFGNRTSTTTDDHNNATTPARQTAVLFGEIDSNDVVTANNGRFPVRVTNAKGHIEYLQYDGRFGTVVRGRDALGSNTYLSYDSLGRLQTESRPDGTQTDIYQAWCPAPGSTPTCPDGGRIKVLAVSDGAPTTASVADILGRDLTNAQAGFDATAVLTTTEYNAKGEVYRVSRPYYSGATVYWNSFGYDALGRITSETNPGETGNLTTYLAYASGSAGQYMSQVSTTDVAGRIRREQFNLRGELVKAIDAAGTFDPITPTLSTEVDTAYTYDQFGNLATVRVENDSATDVINTHDIRGRKRTMHDPDLGDWAYEYYGFANELRRQRDAKLQYTDFAYDVLGRMTSRTDAAGTANAVATTFEYDDVATNGKGQLYRSTITEGSDSEQKTFAYDGLGRPYTVTTVIGGVPGSFVTTQQYDGDGRLQKITYPASTAYPSGLRVRYDYNARGYLAEVRNDDAGNALLWRQDTQTAEGLLTKATFGNDVTTDYTYVPQTGRIDAVRSRLGTAGPYSIQDFGYDFNGLGNLTRREDFNAGKRESMTDADSYDPLNRLRRVRRYTDTTLDETRTVGYDALGNITSKTQITGITTGDYDYATPANCGSVPGAVASGPHAVKRITAGSTQHFCYDANGNQLSSWNFTRDRARTVSWTPYNKPKDIAEGGQSVSFAYGADRARFKQVNGFTGQTTVYVDGLYERESGGATTNHVHYIVAGGAPVAIYESRSDGVQKTRYVHRDHLGNVTHLTNESGGVAETLSYDPWGKRRNADWSNATGPIFPSETPRGYTGHEHLDDVTVIHMNGRAYDPDTGRMLSPDPHVQSPGYAQSFNRFAYVFNNPLKYTDPSGYCTVAGPSCPMSGFGGFSGGYAVPRLGSSRQGTPRWLRLTITSVRFGPTFGLGLGSIPNWRDNCCVIINFDTDHPAPRTDSTPQFGVGWSVQVTSTSYSWMSSPIFWPNNEAGNTQAAVSTMEQNYAGQTAPSPLLAAGRFGFEAVVPFGGAVTAAAVDGDLGAAAKEAAVEAGFIVVGAVIGSIVATPGAGTAAGAVIGKGAHKVYKWGKALYGALRRGADDVPKPRVLRDGEGASPADMAASVDGPTAGSRAGQAERRQELIDEANANNGGVYTCWRCGQTSTNPADMHVGHRNVPTSRNGNLSRENTCLEGAACNLSSGNRGAPSPGMSCAERGSCGAPYGR